MEEKISVVLVNYNGKKYNDKCITSILNSEVNETLQIVVVDNASTDGSMEEMEKKWGSNSKIHFIYMEDNYGFSKANNEGITWSLEQGAEFILLLNNDTEIEPDAIGHMIDCQKEKHGIVVPKVFYADKPDTIWCAGGRLTPVIKKPVHIAMGDKDLGQMVDNKACTFANGCCMLLTDKIVLELGLLNEKFFLYYEDTEYSMRAAEKNISIWFCGKAVVYHKVNGATRGNENPANAYYITRNWLFCNRLHLSKIRFFLFCIYFIFNRLAWIIIWTFQGKGKMVRAVWNGTYDFLVNRTGKY